jgi:mono/diheme cytochrome c family protein
MRFPSRSLLLSLAAVLLSCGRPLTSADDAKLSFNRDIRPILAENCFACHGPDARQRQAGLRLDAGDGATTRLESGVTAIVPGKPDESELLQSITSTDADVAMPPPETWM